MAQEVIENLGEDNASDVNLRLSPSGAASALQESRMPFSIHFEKGNTVRNAFIQNGLLDAILG